MESVIDFWRYICRNGRDKALNIGIIPPKSGRMVSLIPRQIKKVVRG